MGNRGFATTILLVGDLFGIMLFSYFGRIDHGMQASVAGIMSTARPFVIAWLLVGVIRRMFAEAAYANPLLAARNAVMTWVFAGPVAIVLRMIILERPFVWSFLVVATLANMLVSSVWRAGFAGFYSKQSGA